MENEPIIVVNDELIVRYLAGEAEPQEAIAIHDWRELSEENRNYFDRMQQVWQAPLPEQAWQEPDLAQDWSKVKNLLDNPAPEEEPVPQLNSNPASRSSFFLRIAAAVVVLLGVGALAYNLLTKSQAPNLASVYIKADHTLNRELPDLSEVTLTPQSSIAYEKAFAGDTRHVKLSGEAYFQVTPDTQKPFVIEVGKAQVRVVGTSFNINEKGKSVIVSVTSGKVQFSIADTSVYLVKGQTGVWAKDSRSISVVNNVDDNTFGYATKQLSFHNTPLNEVLATLEKTYSCTILLKNTNLATCPVTDKTLEGDSPHSVLGRLEFIFNWKVVEGEKNTFTLEGGKCPASSN